jgi:tetratricopeptide (TPR) repeat protein
LAIERSCEESVTRLERGYAEGFEKLSVAFGKLHLYRQAVIALRQAVQLKPDYSDARFSLGLIYASLHEKRLVVEQLDMLRSIDPEMAHKLLDEIQADKVVNVRRSAL